MRLLLCLLLGSAALLPLAVAEAPPPSYTYSATVLGVHDGDTLKVDIDLGFRIILRGVDLRLQGVYAPELKEPGGLRARDQLRAIIPVGAKITLQTLRSKGGLETTTFQRYVARIWVADANVNEAINTWLVAENLVGGAGVKK